jgi:hypothetical protein
VARVHAQCVNKDLSGEEALPRGVSGRAAALVFLQVELDDDRLLKHRDAFAIGIVCQSLAD